MKTLTTHKTLQNLILLASLFSMILLLPFSAEAKYRPFRYRGHSFRPRFAISASAGFTMYDNEYYDENGAYDEASFSHGVLGVGAHLWIHPSLSLDLGFDAHFITNYETNNSWSYVSFKPGVRVLFLKAFYLRGALEIASCGETKDPFLLGFLVGGGIRVRMGWRLRAFGEVDFQYIITNNTMLPVNFKLGIEYIL